MKSKSSTNNPHAANAEPAKLGACDDAVRRRIEMLHLRAGWWGLLLFLSLGVVLEGLHGFKSGWYLSPAHATRRLLWTLAHAHGTLFSLIHLGFAGTLPRLAAWSSTGRRNASAFLQGAGLLVPAGFFLGGLDPHGGDPGIGIFLVPPGAVLALAAAGLTALAAQECDGRPPD
jgi:hypothetical protein